MIFNELQALYLQDMKAPIWINIVGISAVILGLWGFFEGLASYVVIEVRQLRPNSLLTPYLWAFRLLSVIQMVLGIYYVMAGNVYLRKKKYAREVIRSAIIFSLFFELSTMIFFFLFIQTHESLSFSYRPSLINFLRPTFSALLLTGVIILRPYYFRRYIEHTGHTGLPRIYSIISTLFLSMPFSIFGLWLYCGFIYEDYLEKMDYFKHFFPESLRAPNQLTYVELVFSCMAVIFGLISLNARPPWKFLSYFSLIVGSLFVLLFAFQLI